MTCCCVSRRLNEWENQINVVNKVNHSDVGWTLGWTVLASNEFPPVTLTGRDSIGYYVGRAFIGLMIICLGGICLAGW